MTTLAARVARLETTLPAAESGEDAARRAADEAYLARWDAAAAQMGATLPADVADELNALPEDARRRHPVYRRAVRMIEWAARGDWGGPLLLPPAVCAFLKRYPPLAREEWTDRCPSCGYGHPNIHLVFWERLGHLNVPPPFPACAVCGAALPTIEMGPQKPLLPLTPSDLDTWAWTP